MIKEKFNMDIDYEKFSEEALVNYCDILNTYSNAQKDLTCKYLKARYLRRKNYKIIDISKILGISKNTIYGWNNSKGNPYSLNCIKDLINLELLPLTSQNNPKFVLVLKLYAYILTDGNISERLANIKIAGELEDLKLLSQEINENFPNVRLSIHIYNTEGVLDGRKIRGISPCLYINSATLGRLLYVLGVPKGDKVKQRIVLPDWIFKLDSNLKNIFLGVLWSAEGSKPLKTQRGYNLAFSMSKDIRLKEYHIVFLNQIRVLFGELGIETTELKEDKRTTIRRDGIESQRTYFYIRSNYKNFIRFYENIPIFAMNKAQKFDEAYKHYNEIAKRTEKRDVLQKNVLNSADEFFSKGYSTKRTAKIIGIPRSTLRYWLNKRERRFGK